MGELTPKEFHGMVRDMDTHGQKPLYLGFVISILGMLAIFTAIVLEAEALGSLYYPTIIGGVLVWAGGQWCIHGPLRRAARH